MIKTLASVALSLGIAFGTFLPVLSIVPLQVVSPDRQEELGLDEQIWRNYGQKGDRQALLTAIDHSLTYLRSPRAIAAYRRYPVRGITRDRVIRSLERFRELVLSSNSPEELQAAVREEFVFYRATGKDGRGTVGFTGYFEPTYTASRVPTQEYRYPLYRLPPNFSRWSRPHPTRLQLEGADGLSGDGRLRGLELVWLRYRLEAFLVQIQGSARLQMTDGSIMTVGFAGKTDRPYRSVGRELVNDGKMNLAGLTLPRVIEYFDSSPEELNRYLPRNPGFVFFRETGGAAATGSLSVPVTAERSIATDKSLMPPGALALIHAQIPFPNRNGELEQRRVSRYVLDQDTGGAIRGPGRVDIFMGTGTEAGERAGRINSNGELYYLLVKN
ncbi:murein transglycosylase A [Aerosakkonema funiforme]|uniref:peptidoglycan lytic exotransglycosylase n=1 Tax=Aerosakkonema funiforme FACHB-1375 TaxID=2949571 RepID=A0A926VD67_9CYAN|nr:murein transglycosylase A [Aerosakkonema funiforme]MBD2181555.1 murein transglycosylase A [Aerosakkonema funiforme FACHB-1375]